MTAQELLGRVKEMGIVLKPDGDRLLYRPIEAVQSDLLEHLRTHKAELIDLLTWPEECLTAEQEHGHRCARLFPLVGEEVNTPMGQGRLIEALPERAVVSLCRRPERLVVLLPAEVAPPEAVPNGEISRSPMH